MASGRFPGKPLHPILGLALTLHVHDRCRLSSRVDRVVIATCDGSIRDAARAHGADVLMTADTHPGCVDRVEEAVRSPDLEMADDDLVLMVQGDEILVGPDMLDDVIDAYVGSGAPVINVASPILTDADHDDPNVVKVVVSQDGRALCFSRAPVPSRARAAEVPRYYQTGIIGFSRAFVETFGRLPRTPLEIAEHIDMMRTLEHGYPIRVVFTDRPIIGVDTPDDARRAEAMLRADPWTSHYLEPVR